MCGIAGFWQKGINKDSQKNSLKDMMTSISYRGPDDIGFYQNEVGLGLVHTRLSIIDLTDAGHQPMFSDDGNIVIVFKAKFINIKELENKFKLN